MSRVSVSGLRVLVAQLLQHTRVPQKYLLMDPVFVERAWEQTWQWVVVRNLVTVQVRNLVTVKVKVLGGAWGAPWGIFV